MNREDRKIAQAVASQEKAIAAVIDEVAAGLARGGRLFYVGAGTSGRLGVLDASECPPTYGADPETVQGIIAGGPEALVRSLEGAEDDAGAGREAIGIAGIGERDFVLGIASSGTTPFVHAALEAALEAGAATGLLSCTAPPQDIASRVGHLITPLTGPEAIAGSTRLKAGTATKMVLNMISTGAMIRLGKVYGNLMVDLRAVSRKLVDRGLRIITALTGLDERDARRLLVTAGGSVKTALAMHETKVERFTAERRLDACGGFLSRVIHRFPAGSPDRDFSEFEERPIEAEEWELLLGRLSSTPDAVRRAAAFAAGASNGATVGRSPRDVAWQVDHLTRYEWEAIRPRLEAWREADGLTFDSWEDATGPGPQHEAADLGSLLEAFRRQRELTLSVLRSAGDEFASRKASLGDEAFTAYQFLRGTAQHDDAHVTRIGERLHRSLLEEDG